MKIAHIGFGKTATTALQLSLFPRLAADLGLEYINVDDPRARAHVSRLLFAKDFSSEIRASKSYLLSAEDMHGWDPFFWERYADWNRRFLGQDCHILITLREPRSYLTSVYLQVCLHEGNIQTPCDFFLSRANYSPYNCAGKFSIDDFSYQKIIDIYRERFGSVTTVKYESMGDLLFLKQFADISEPMLEGYRAAFKAQIVNRSFSSRAVRLTFRLQSTLRLFGLSIEPNTVHGSLVALAYLQEASEKPSGDGANAFTAPQRCDVGGCSKLSSYFRWPSLMHRLDRYIPGKRFQMDFSVLPQIDLPKLTGEYGRLPNISTYRNHCVPESA